MKKIVATIIIGIHLFFNTCMSLSTKSTLAQLTTQLHNLHKELKKLEQWIKPVNPLKSEQKAKPHVLCSIKNYKYTTNELKKALQVIPLEKKKKITILNLENNNIDYLPQGIFSNFNNVEMLNLSGNQLKSLSGRSLEGLHNLKELQLNNNPLKVITGILPLPNLKKLSLSNTDLQLLPDDFFEQTINLQELTMNNTNLEKFPTSLLTLQYLTKISFNGKNYTKEEFDALFED